MKIITAAKLIAGPIYTGMCDASAAAALSDVAFIAATDELTLNFENELNAFQTHSTATLRLVDSVLTRFLDSDPPEKKPKRREADIEGAARLGEQIYWVTSHGRNTEAEFRQARHRFFAVVVEKVVEKKDEFWEVKPTGRAYDRLVNDLKARPELRDLLESVDGANAKAPENGGISIEGLSPWGEALLLGLRSPLTQIKAGNALLVPLLNPLETVQGAPANLDEAIELDLGNRGIRDIEFHEATGSHLILAGAVDSIHNFALYQWSGQRGDQAREVPFNLQQTLMDKELADFAPEALVAYPDGLVQIMSDDGDRLIADNLQSKDAPDHLRTFRSVWLSFSVE